MTRDDIDYWLRQSSGAPQQAVSDPLAELRNAVEFLDQMRAAAEAGEDVTGTGIAKDARNWLERAARAAIEARPLSPLGFVRQFDLDNFPNANILLARSAEGDWQVPVYCAALAKARPTPGEGA
ncbi:hypothetical protein [Variovorax paradoxus]|uniref:hypothetical protein n=1 Tax=Variovorax paradoxus TaxID=34073 RepID=UPI00193149D1|nr:hypothetical protein INQ48_18215 [Variovorax paradoxus]